MEATLVLLLVCLSGCVARGALPLELETRFVDLLHAETQRWAAVRLEEDHAILHTAHRALPAPPVLDRLAQRQPDLLAREARKVLRLHPPPLPPPAAAL